MLDLPIHWSTPMNGAPRGSECYEGPFWKVGSHSGFVSRVRFASTSFKVIPMFVDCGLPSKVPPKGGLDWGPSPPYEICEYTCIYVLSLMLLTSNSSW